MALQLRSHGWDASVLDGGLTAWRIDHEAEAIPDVA